MATKKAPGQEVPKYPPEELLQNSEALFNCKQEIILGALHNHDRKEFSINEMNKLIDNFLKRSVF